MKPEMVRSVWENNAGYTTVYLEPWFKSAPAGQYARIARVCVPSDPWGETFFGSGPEGEKLSGTHRENRIEWDSLSPEFQQYFVMEISK